MTVNVFADATGALESPGARWSRILERAWAIILLDAGLSLVQDVGIAALAAGRALSELVLGMLVLWLAAMLVYAEPFICVEGQASGIMAIPFAVLQSMALAWTNLSRVFALFAVILAFDFVDVLVGRAASAAGWGAAAVYVSMAYELLAQIPLAALFTVAYLDTRSAALS